MKYPGGLDYSGLYFYLMRGSEQTSTMMVDFAIKAQRDRHQLAVIAFIQDETSSATKRNTNIWEYFLSNLSIPDIPGKIHEAQNLWV